MTRTIAQEIDAILPDPDARRLMLPIFAESMRYIRWRKPEWCLVKFDRNHLRLFAGRLIVLTLESNEIWVAIDPEVSSIDWPRLRSWRWDERSYPRYRRVPSRNGYYSPRMDEHREWGNIQRAHLAYLGRALSPGVAPDHRSITGHEVAVVEYIDSIVPDLGHTVPDGDESGGAGPPFDPHAIGDTRTRTLALMVQRPGQSQFREALLRAYDRTCCFSGCSVEQVLEAAHIVPYQGLATDHIGNGLLLRGDLHTLFDHGLLTVDTATMTVVVAPALRDSSYAELNGREIRLPRDPRDQPARELLEHHHARSKAKTHRTHLAMGG